jgi:hypothetical protein
MMEDDDREKQRLEDILAAYGEDSPEWREEQRQLKIKLGLDPDKPMPLIAGTFPLDESREIMGTIDPFKFMLDDLKYGLDSYSSGLTNISDDVARTIIRSYLTWCKTNLRQILYERYRSK